MSSRVHPGRNSPVVIPARIHNHRRPGLRSSRAREDMTRILCILSSAHGAGLSRSLSQSLSESVSRIGRVVPRAVDVDVSARGGQGSGGSGGSGNDQWIATSIDIESVKYEGGMFHVCGTMRHPASRRLVYETLVDYDALPRVFHNVDSCEVRREEERLVVSQMVGWKFLIFRGAFETELEVVEDPEEHVLTFSLLRSAFMKEFVGDWEVKGVVTDDGRTEVGSLIRHELSVMPVVQPPQRIGNITAKIFETQVRCVLRDLAEELSLRAGE